MDKAWTLAPVLGRPLVHPHTNLGRAGCYHPPTDDLVERDTLRRLPAGLPAVRRCVKKQADSATVRDRPWFGSADLRTYC